MAELKRKLPHAAPEVIVANPSQWSEKSQQSLVFLFNWRKEYRDIAYRCWTCKKASIFSARDQQIAYEIKKAYIDQRRSLCGDCYVASKTIATAISAREAQWAESKQSLANDAAFLADWLALLVSGEKYGRRPNTAAKNMLKKLLEKVDGV